MSSASPRSDRVLHLQGTSNFRDLGGYRSAGDRRAVRWRCLFRSAHLAGLTEADHARLAPLGIARTFDFRGESERAEAPCAMRGAVRHALTIEPTVVQRMQDLLAAGRSLTAPVAADLMGELYRNLVDHQSHRFAQLFEQLLAVPASADAAGAAQPPALVFHCTAGKDRTGVAAALILLALGVSRDTVLHDYLLTNQLYRPSPPPEDSEVPAEALAVLWSVQPAFLEAAFEAIESRHGGFDAYLERRLGIGPDARRALAERYLEPVAD